MESIEIWVDGSYRAKKAGCCFYLSAPNLIEKPLLIYSCQKVKRSTQAELLSIIYAFKYLYYLCLDITEYNIKIYCDEMSIVEAFNNKKYKVWQEKDWKNGKGKAIKSSVAQWYELTCLFESFGNSKIEFIKVQSQKDPGNKIVDKYSNYARTQFSLLEGSFIVLEYINDKNGFVEKELLESIDSKMSKKILNGVNPWTKNRAAKIVEWKYNAEDIVYIDPVSIIVREDTHLNCNQLTLNGAIGRTLKEGRINTPIVVRREDEQYILVSGIVRLVIGKLLNLSDIPCIIVDLNHKEFFNNNTGSA